MAATSAEAPAASDCRRRPALHLGFVRGGTKIDLGLPFVPEHMTPLFHTPLHALLDDEEKLAYNQITGLVINEVTYVLEVALRGLMQAAIAHPLVSRDREFVGELRDFLHDEAVHVSVWRRLNLLTAPSLYRRRPFNFVRMPKPGRMSRLLLEQPARFPFLFLLIMSLEERAGHFGAQIARHDGLLEPAYRAVHAAHAVDEARHVQFDRRLVDIFFGRMGRIGKRVNAALFLRATREFAVTPRRGGLRAVEALVDRFPRLRPRRAELRDAIVSLGGCPSFHRTMMDPEGMPFFFDTIGRYPEFDAVRRWALDGGRDAR